MLMSTLVVMLVSTTFLVQNQYYASQIQRSAAQDNARSATELMASEVRSAMGGGVTVAGARTLTVRTPIFIAVVCHRQSNNVDVYTIGGAAAVDTLEVAGVATRNAVTGAWTYGNISWTRLKGSGGSPAVDCEANGADTVGVGDDFHRLRRINTLPGMSTPSEGDILMAFRETTFSIRTSTMDPTTLALFRQVYGKSAVEYATGMDTSAKFQYRTALGTYTDTVTAANLSKIDVVRFVADTRKRAVTGGVDDVTFGWSVNIALRNVRGG